MNVGTLYVRVVAQDKDRGYMLLAGFDSGVVQRTAANITTLSDPTRATLDAAIARFQKQYSAAEVKDVTASAITKKLAKMFGETATQAAVPAAATFGNLGVGHYLPSTMTQDEHMAQCEGRDDF